MSMSGAIPPLPNTPPWRSTQLKHRGIFTFSFANIVYPYFARYSCAENKKQIC